jgi:antitoxin VapB
MPLTRAFKSGNSQAVRIPAELAYEDTNFELSIDRYVDVIAMPKPSRIEAHEPIAVPERGFWLER